MLYDICYDEHDTLFTIITDGNIDAVSEDHMISDLVTHTKWVMGANILIDHTKSLAGHLSSQDIINIAHIGAKHFKPCPPNKIAIIIQDSMSVGSAILWDVILSDKVPVQSKIFTNVQLARQWLQAV